MGRYLKTDIGKGIGTSPQITLENQEYENKVNEIEENEENKQINDKQIVNNELEISAKGKKLSSSTTNEKLKNVIRELYRPGATIGDGGTADAIRCEISTGELVGGKSHIQKGIERLKNLDNILKKIELSETDKKIAKDLYKDLKDALGGRKNEK